MAAVPTSMYRHTSWDGNGTGTGTPLATGVRPFMERRGWTRATIPPSSRANQAHDGQGRQRLDRPGPGAIAPVLPASGPARAANFAGDGVAIGLIAWTPGPGPLETHAPIRTSACRPGDGRSRDRIGRSCPATSNPTAVLGVSCCFGTLAIRRSAFASLPLQIPSHHHGRWKVPLRAASSALSRLRTDASPTVRVPTAGDRGRQLTAGGVDLGPPGHPHGGIDAQVLQLVPESPHAPARGAPDRIPGGGVQRDQVHVRPEWTGELDSSTASEPWSLTSWIMAHSMESRRPVASTYSAQAAARTASG